MQPISSNLEGCHLCDYPLHPNGHGTDNWFKGATSFFERLTKGPGRLPQHHRFNELPSGYQVQDTPAIPSSISDKSALSDDDEGALCHVSLSSKRSKPLVNVNQNSDEQWGVHELVG